MELFQKVTQKYIEGEGWGTCTLWSELQQQHNVSSKISNLFTWRDAVGPARDAVSYTETQPKVQRCVWGSVCIWTVVKNIWTNLPVIKNQSHSFSPTERWLLHSSGLAGNTSSESKAEVIFHTTETEISFKSTWNRPWCWANICQLLRHCDGIKCALLYDTDHSTCFVPHRSKEKAARERKRGGKKDESDGVERKCVHSRLILGGRTHWFPARTRVRAMLMQQKHSCLLWQCWLFMSCWFSIVCLGLVWKDVGAHKCVSTCVCV